LQPEPFFARCRFNLLGNVNARLNLLKPDAVAKGWLAVFRADIIVQESSGQPDAPLIAALERNGHPPADCQGANQLLGPFMLAGGCFCRYNKSAKSRSHFPGNTEEHIKWFYWLIQQQIT
jgi:hypothetical protein